MPKPIVTSFLAVLEQFRPALTQPSFENFVIIACGWVLTQGAHAVTGTLVATGVAGRRHHEAFHRFFSRGTWDPDVMGRLIFERLLRYAGDGPLQVAIDDTLAPKKGPEVFGIGTHVDAVRSTRKHKAFCFGHCWVVLSVMVRVPFSSRTWALPVLFRLYRNKTGCPKAEYAKKTELARQLIDVLVRWVGPRRIELTADGAYCNDTVMRGLADNVVLFGAMRPDAVLTEAPPEPRPGCAGRPCKRGRTLPKPLEIANDHRIPWCTADAILYGRKTAVQYKTFCAQWYRACGTRMLRIVVVKTSKGRVPFRVFFCTDTSVDVVRLLETYALRWGIEVFFREGKQLLGFADSSARKEEAVRRVAPFVGLLYTALVIWFIEGAHQSGLATPPVRPWYAHKQGLCFADILRTARTAMVDWDILVPSNDFAYLRKRASAGHRPPESSEDVPDRQAA